MVGEEGRGNYYYQVHNTLVRFRDCTTECGWIRESFRLWWFHYIGLLAAGGVLCGLLAGKLSSDGSIHQL